MPLMSEYDALFNSNGYNINRHVNECKSYDINQRLDSYEDISIKEIDMDPMITFANIGIRNAVDIKVVWRKPKLKELNKSLGVNISKEAYLKYEEVDDEFANRFIMQLIRSSEVNGEYKLYMYCQIQKFIGCILKEIDNNFDSFKFEKINLGTFVISYNNINGEVYRDNVFDIGMNVMACAGGQYYQFILDYLLVKE